MTENPQNEAMDQRVVGPEYYLAPASFWNKLEARIERIDQLRLEAEAEYAELRETPDVGADYMQVLIDLCLRLQSSYADLDNIRKRRAPWWL